MCSGKTAIVQLILLFGLSSLCSQGEVVVYNIVQVQM